MQRTITLIIVVVLAGLLWVVLDFSADRAADDRNGDSPSRPSETTPPPEPAEPPLEAAKAPAVSISGHILTPAGERAGGAEVRAVALDPDSWPRREEAFRAVRADDIGRFKVNDLPPGLYRVEARTPTARGYHPILPVRKGRETVVAIRLKPIAMISGQVITEFGVPVIGATVSADLGGVLREVQKAVGVASLPLAGRLQGVTDAAGAFRIGDLPVGQYELEVKADGYVPRRVPFVNAPVKHIPNELLDTFTARGTVVWGAGRKIASVRILAEPTGTATTLTPGPVSAAFEVPGLPRGPHTLRAIASDGGMATARIEVVPGGGNDHLEMQLLPGGRVTGRVRADHKHYIPGPIEALSVDRTAGQTRLVPVASCVADKNGRFEILLAYGEWILRPLADGFRTRALDRLLQRSGTTRDWAEDEIFTVGSGGEKWDLDLVRIGAVSGRVTWTGGWPAAGLEIHLGNDHRADTDLAGRFRMIGIPLDRDISVYAGGQSQKVRLSSPDHEARCDFVLPRKLTGTVRGRVFSEESQPVSGVTVFFTDGFAVTDIDGRFERTDVSPGRHELRFLAPGYAVGFLPRLEVAAAIVTEIPLMVLPWHPRRVDGRVTDPDGLPIPGARVRVHFPELLRSLDAVTDAGGWFRQEGPGGAPGKVWVKVTAAGRAPRSVVIPPEAPAVNLRVELPVASGVRILFARPVRSVVYLRVWLKTKVTLPRTEFQFSLQPGTAFVDLSDLPVGEYRADIYAGKHRVGRSDRFEVRADAITKIGPFRLSK